MRIKAQHAAMEVDLGYRGFMVLTIKFTDQNGLDHYQTFEIEVVGEKLTTLKVDKMSESGDRQTIFVSMK